MKIFNYMFKAILLALAIFFIIRTPLFANAENNQTIKNINAVLSYYIDVEGRKNCTLDLISLLPQTINSKQDILDIKFSPEPERIFINSGNKYAYWKLKGKEIKNVIEIHLSIKLYQQLLETKTQQELSKKDRLNYLKREKYLDVNAKIIKNAYELIPHTSNNIEQIKEILNFVDNNMKPSKAAFKMLGAAKALKQGEGDCTEYTDLFVTLCRQFGLPAKHISGYILTDKGSIGHSWAEVYSKERGWIYVDPLHMDNHLGTFDKLDNKYLAFSGIRNDQTLKKGMLFAWNVRNAKKARVVPKIVTHNK